MNATTDQKRVAHMLARMTTPPPRERRDTPEQLVALAKKGYGPALAILKVRAERCPQHRAALDGLVLEATGTPAPAATPAPAPAAVPVAPPKQAGPVVVTCTESELRAMDPADRYAFLGAGGKVVADVRPTMTRAAFNQLPPAAKQKFCLNGGKVTA